MVTGDESTTVSYHFRRVFSIVYVSMLFAGLCEWTGWEQEVPLGYPSVWSAVPACTNLWCVTGNTVGCSAAELAGHRTW